MDPVTPPKPNDNPPVKPKAEDHIGRLTALRGKVLDKIEEDPCNMDEIKSGLAAVNLLNQAIKESK